MVWTQLTDHLEVLYGAAAALVIVLVLTPAVGSAARHLRLVDRRADDDRARSEVPRPGGLALLLGVIVPPSVAFVPLSGAMRGIVLGAAVATTVGAVDDFRRLNWWQKLGGQLLAAGIPALGFGVYLQSFTFVGVYHVPKSVGVPVTVVGIVAVM